MTLRYGYITHDRKHHGFYQCEVEDFKKFWKAANAEIRCAVVELANGDVWLYCKYAKEGRWQVAGRPKLKRILTSVFN